MERTESFGINIILVRIKVALLNAATSYQYENSGIATAIGCNKRSNFIREKVVRWDLLQEQELEDYAIDYVLHMST